MKKVLFALSAALVLFSACQEDGPAPEVTFALTNDNVEVAGLTSDYLVVVDAAAKTAAIEVAYADKAQLQALEVNFVGIPSDVTVENFTYDFSAGATREVAVSQNGATVNYVFSAVAAAPQPKFLTMSVAPAVVVEGEEPVLGEAVEVAGGTAKLKGSTNLASLAFNYTVSPAGTKVLVDGAEIATGAILDFSDKVNGVTFTLKCEDVEETANVKIVTTGFSSIERVWGRYVQPETADANWYDEAATGVPASDNMRNIAADAQYVYLPNTGKGLVYAFDLLTGEFKKTLSAPAEVVFGGTFKVCDAEVMQNGTSSVLVVANMAMNAGGNLRAYAYTSPDADPVNIINYTIEDGRYGDKFSVAGTWEDGEILFFNQKDKTTMLGWKVKNGVVASEPVVYNVPVSGASYSKFVKYSDNEWIWGGAGPLYSVWTRSGDAYTMAYQEEASDRFPTPMHDIEFVKFNEQEYMIYTRLLNSNQDAAVRFQELNAATLLESMKGVDVTTDKQLGLGDPQKLNVTAVKNGNSMGGSDVVVIGEDVYVAGCVPGAGMSLFKLKN